MQWLVSFYLLVGVFARPGTKGRLPPLGWNTWCTGNKCGNDWCTSSEVLDVAQHIKDSGLQTLGYDHINLDDCWGTRNATTNQIQGDPTRFPEGMPSFIQKVHNLGFKFGLYTDIGEKACHHPFVGSWPQYQQDANTFAEWEVDYVKFDGCDKPADHDAATLTCNMSDALNKTKREMWLNFHCWHDKRCAECGNSFRIGPDHHDNWDSTMGIIQLLKTRQDFWGPDPDYGWPDPDFIFTGGQGCGGDAGPAGQRCPGQSDIEYMTEFSIWGIAGGEIIFASDPRNMSDIQRKVLFNKEILDIYRDTSGFRSVRVIGDGKLKTSSKTSDAAHGSDTMVWARPLDKGAAAVALFNGGSKATSMTVRFSDIPDRNWDVNSQMSVRNLWEHASEGEHTGSFTAKDVPSHGTTVLKLEPVQTFIV